MCCSKPSALAYGAVRSCELTKRAMSRVPAQFFEKDGAVLAPNDFSDFADYEMKKVPFQLRLQLTEPSVVVAGHSKVHEHCHRSR